MLRFVKFLTGVPFHGMVRGLKRTCVGNSIMGLLDVYWAMVPPLLLFAAALVGSCWVGLSTLVGLLAGTMVMGVWTAVVVTTKTDGFAQ